MTTPKTWWMVQAVAMVALLGMTVWSHLRIGALEARLSERPTEASAASVPARTDSLVRRDRRVDPAEAFSGRVQADPPPMGNPVDELWTEEGRAAIDDVVTERQERQRERRSERWQAMIEARTDRMVERMSAELDLTSADAESVRDLMLDYTEARGALWRQMRSDEDVDAAAMVLEAERVREAFGQSLADLLGEEGAQQALALIRGPGF